MDGKPSGHGGVTSHLVAAGNSLSTTIVSALARTVLGRGVRLVMGRGEREPRHCHPFAPQRETSLAHQRRVALTTTTTAAATAA